MARKKDYSKEAIIDSTIDLISKYGKNSFSVRNVASHMKSSTQPIYSNFKDSDKLYRAVLLEVEKRLLVQIIHPYSQFPFRNMGYGFTLFAKENPNLFDAFFSDLEMNKIFIVKFLEKLRTILNQDARFSQMSPENKDSLLNTMWTFSYGLASLLIKGLVDDSSEDAIKEMVLETGTAIIAHHFRKGEGK